MLTKKEWKLLIASTLIFGMFFYVVFGGNLTPSGSPHAKHVPPFEEWRWSPQDVVVSINTTVVYENTTVAKSLLTMYSNITSAVITEYVSGVEVTRQIEVNMKGCTVTHSTGACDAVGSFYDVVTALVLWYSKIADTSTVLEAIENQKLISIPKVKEVEQISVVEISPKDFFVDVQLVSEDNRKMNLLMYIKFKEPLENILKEYSLRNYGGYK